MVVWLYVFPIGEVAGMGWASAISSSNMFHYVVEKAGGIFIAAQKQTEKSAKEEGPEVAFFLNFFLDVLLFFIAVPSLILLDIR